MTKMTVGSNASAHQHRHLHWETASRSSLVSTTCQAPMPTGIPCGNARAGEKKPISTAAAVANGAWEAVWRSYFTHIKRCGSVFFPKQGVVWKPKSMAWDDLRQKNWLIFQWQSPRKDQKIVRAVALKVKWLILPTSLHRLNWWTLLHRASFLNNLHVSFISFPDHCSPTNLQVKGNRWKNMK